GTYTFAVAVFDVVAVSATQTYSLTVDPGIVAGPSALAAATEGNAYAQALTATGGSGAGYVWTRTPVSILPAWRTLSANSTLDGRATATAAGSYSFSLRVAGSTGAFADQVYTLTVNPAIDGGPDMTLPDGVAGGSYSVQLIATGGSGTGYHFALTAGTL